MEEKKAIGPSQKLIRRKSPGRPIKKQTEEEETLLQYEAPPQVFVKNSNSLSRSESPRSDSPSVTRALSNISERGGEEKNSPVVNPNVKYVIETDIDFTPENAANRPISRNIPVKQVEVRHSPERIYTRRNPSSPSLRSPKSPNNVKGGFRQLKGEYKPRSKLEEEEEQFV